MDGQPYTVFDRSMLASGPNLHAPLLDKMAPHMAQLRQSVDFSNWFVPPTGLCPMAMRNSSNRRGLCKLQRPLIQALHE